MWTCRISPNNSIHSLTPKQGLSLLARTSALQCLVSNLYVCILHSSASSLSHAYQIRALHAWHCLWNAQSDIHHPSSMYNHVQSVSLSLLIQHTHSRDLLQPQLWTIVPFPEWHPPFPLPPPCLLLDSHTDCSCATLRVWLDNSNHNNPTKALHEHTCLTLLKAA